MMIVVTGTIRSGTSMWMQILGAAGFEVIGEKFPADWEQSLRDANRDGFFESQLVAGIYYATNPHPSSGAFLHPAATRRHAVKVFIRGVVRSDLAYLDHCIATVREWRAYCASAERIHTLAGSSSSVPYWLIWWSENLALIRDLSLRGYPVFTVSYDALLRDPDAILDEVFDWIGSGDKVAARAVVDPSKQSRGGAPTPEGVPPQAIEVFDELYAAIDGGAELRPALLNRIDEVDRLLRPRLLEHEASHALDSAMP